MGMHRGYCCSLGGLLQTTAPSLQVIAPLSPATTGGQAALSMARGGGDGVDQALHLQGQPAAFTGSCREGRGEQPGACLSHTVTYHSRAAARRRLSLRPVGSR